MRVVTFARIREFSKSHPDSEVALREWYYKTHKATWNNFSDVRDSFNSADSVGNKRFVFNIRGNHYRLVAIILFQIQTVYIRFIGTHSEYDKVDCRNI